jgi:hypothetical protein
MGVADDHRAAVVAGGLVGVDEDAYAGAVEEGDSLQVQLGDAGVPPGRVQQHTAELFPGGQVQFTV